MRYLIISSSLLSILFSFTCQANGLIKMEFPETWELEQIHHGTADSYVLTNKELETSLLYFCTPPLPIEELDTQKMVDEEIDFYLIRAKQRLDENTGITRVDKQKIEGLEFSGYSIIMFHRDNFLLALFSITNGHTVLSGQFTGSNEKWEIAAKILKSIKYKG